ncbi:MAG: hypothetical protein MJ252_29230 [archaeon]|nr:hypothetical protein [archaeon]
MGQNHLKGLQPIKYYRNLEKTKTSMEETGEKLKQQIKLRARIESAESGSSYKVIVSGNDNFTNVLLTSSEQKADLSKAVNFQEFMVMDYYFEIEQPFFLQLSKDGSNYHRINTTLGSIFGAKNNTFIQQAPGGETISIIAEPLLDSKEYLVMKLVCLNLKDKDYEDKHKGCYYLISSNCKIYQSEPISESGIFQVVNIPINIISPEFKIEFFNYKNQVKYSATCTPIDFVNPNGIYKEISFNTKGGNTITFKNNTRILKNFNFMDYVKAGVRLGLDLAIDFTSSNGHPLQPKSLHRVGPGIENDYEKAIKACGSIIAQYDYDQLFPVYGFGCKIRDNTEPSMCFPITLCEDPFINGIENVLNAYHEVMNNITFYGPTYFAPILNQVIANIRQEGNNLNYHILMILTDGVINDMNYTIDALVEGSFLPLSVIIIGIGDADFNNMVILDSDDAVLEDSRGKKASRDLVQFVPFNKYKNNPNELAKQVLEEIPRQIVEYYTQNDLYPENLAS